MAAEQVPLEVPGDGDVLAGSAGEEEEPGRQSRHSAAGLGRGGQLYPCMYQCYGCSGSTL